MSRVRAEEAVCDLPWAAISISERQHPELSKENRIGLLQVKFHDIDFASDNYITFNKNHAQQILDFAKNIWDKADILLVHCEAGLSRSAATAAALSKIYFGTDEEFFKYPYTPNMLIYRTILNLHHGVPVPVPKPRPPEPTEDDMEEWATLTDLF